MTLHRSLWQRGFTLIELMIVVAVVAILASIAYPAYSDSILKGRRAEARTALMELMQQQERYMTQRGTYLKFSNSGGVTTPTSAAATFKVFSGDNQAGAAYLLSTTECAAPLDDLRNCVVATATPVKTDAVVGNLTLTSTGIKGCSGTTTNKKLCWP